MSHKHIPRRRGFLRDLFPPRQVLYPGTRRPVPHPLSMRVVAARRQMRAALLARVGGDS